MKIPTPAEQRAAYLAQLQPHVPEPILAIGFLSSAGYAEGLRKDHAAGKAMGLFSPLVGRLFRRQATSTLVEESRNDLVAVTESTINLFEFPKDHSGFRVLGPPTVWQRSQVRVTAEPKGRFAQPIHVVLPDGTIHDYDISNGVQDWATFSDAMRDLLLSPVAA